MLNHAKMVAMYLGMIAQYAFIDGVMPKCLNNIIYCTPHYRTQTELGPRADLFPYGRVTQITHIDEGKKRDNIQ